MAAPARYFIPIEDLKRFPDIMDCHQFNKLHLHLASHRDWRRPISPYPAPAEAGRSLMNVIPGKTSRARLSNHRQFIFKRFNHDWKRMKDNEPAFRWENKK